MEIAHEIFEKILAKDNIKYEMRGMDANDIDNVVASAKLLISDDDYARESLRTWKNLVHINNTGKLKMPSSSPEQFIVYEAIGDAIEKCKN